MLKSARLIGSIGPALIYVVSEQFLNLYMLQYSSKFYWKYHDKPVVYGPFEDQPSIERHIQGCLIASERTNDVLPDTVIHADFKAKRRVG